jgi:hypothetical protein
MNPEKRNAVGVIFFTLVTILHEIIIKLSPEEAGYSPHGLAIRLS